MENNDIDLSYKLAKFVLPVALHPSKTADTRSADKLVSKKELLESSEQHIADVNRVIQMFTSALSLQGQYHDWTKLQYIDLFYSDFNKAYGKYTFPPRLLIHSETAARSRIAPPTERQQSVFGRKASTIC